MLFRGQHAEYVMVLVDWFAIISSFLLIPPVGIWIAKLSLLTRWVYITPCLVKDLVKESNISCYSFKSHQIDLFKPSL